MNVNQDPLAGLKDIHLPSDIGWWPPAPGWWVVLLLLLAILYFVGRKLAAYLKNKKYRCEALGELRKCVASYEDGDGTRLVNEISVIIRRVAIHHYGRQEVADLSGDIWLAFLDRTGNTDKFTIGEGAVFGHAMYSGEVEVDPDRLSPIVENWIKAHK